MRKIYLFFTIVVIAVLSSCFRHADKEKDIVKIWWYKQEGDTFQNYVVENAINRIESYAELNDIEIDIRQFLHSDLSYNDYMLKRNLAIEHGDLDMTIDLPGNLYGLRDIAGSYDRIKNYENIFDNFKNQYCIPISTDLRVNFVNNDALIKYNIQPRNVITLDEYYEIKQRMKADGAEFKLNAGEFSELVDYYYRKNGLKILNDQKRIYIDKKAILTAVHELIYDIKNNYDYDYFIKNPGDFDYRIIEKKSGYEFSGLRYNYLALNYNEFRRNLPSIKNNTIVLWDENCYIFYEYSNYIMPCLFIPRNSKSSNVYTVADTLFSDGFQISLYNSGNAGVITESDDVRGLIGFDENWNYVGVKNITDVEGNKYSLKIYPHEEEEKLYEVLTKGYEIIRNMDMSYFFSNVRYFEDLNSFIGNTAIEAIKDDKILENLDIIVDDFIINLNVSSN